MSQKAKTSDKKGAKTSSHVGQSARGSSTPAEESKVSGLAQKAKPASNQRLRKNLDEKVAPQAAARATSKAKSSEARQTTSKPKNKVAPNSTLDLHFK